MLLEGLEVREAKQTFAQKTMGVEKRDSLHTLGGNINQRSHYGEMFRNSSKRGKVELSYKPEFPFQVFIQKICSWRAEELSAFPCLLKRCS